MRLTADLLHEATGCSSTDAIKWAPVLDNVLEEYAILVPNQVAMFLAQIGHESGSFKYVSEIWGPTAAQKRYEGRADLGNIYQGDGSKYRGHGLIQITGRANHAEMRDKLRLRLGPTVPDFEEHPEELTIPMWAAYSAGEFWSSRNLNPPAAAGDIELVTRRINGGLNGLEDRTKRYERAKEALWNYSTGSSQPSQPLPAPGSLDGTKESQTNAPSKWAEMLAGLWNQIAKLLKLR